MRFYNLLIVSLVLFASVSARADDQKVSVPRNKQRIVAQHEGAHAIACKTLNSACRLTLIKVWTEAERGQTKLGETFRSGLLVNSTAKERFVMAISLLAGAAAEKVIRNQASQGYSKDWQQALALCRQPLADDAGLPTPIQTERCLANAERQALNLVRINTRPILKLTNLVMSQKPRNGIRKVSGEAVQKTLAHSRLYGLSEKQLAD